MIEAIKSIILDFQEVSLKTGVPRRLHVTTPPNRAAVFIGVRRSGKTTYLFQIMQRLIDEGVQRQNILYLNFFDDRLHRLKQEEPGLITEAYYQLYPEKKNEETVYFFFDEIQEIPGWESFVERIMRAEKCKVFLTGSSANMLSRKIATQMRGRALSWELFPFSFKEFLDYKGIVIKDHLSTRKRLFVQQAFDQYWLQGGFPEVAGLDNHLRIKIHQEYFRAVLFRDMIERYNIAHPRALTDLAHRLMESTAALYSVNRLTRYLQSLGHNAPKSNVSDYLAWFDDAYFFFSVPIFDASIARRNVNPKKIYCIDHALVRSTASGILVNSGRLLENLIFSALRRLTTEIYYVKTKNGAEVDFIAILPDRSRLLIQVCESMANPQTRNREVAALNNAMIELDQASGVIVTRQETDDLDVEAGKIRVIPAWRFLLDLPEL